MRLMPRMFNFHENSSTDSQDAGKKVLSVKVPLILDRLQQNLEHAWRKCHLKYKFS
jgi:hypothetical protein